MMDKVPDITELIVENEDVLLSVDLHDSIDYYKEEYLKFYHGYGELKVPIIGELSNIRRGLLDTLKRAQTRIRSNIEGIESELMLVEVGIISKEMNTNSESALLYIKKNGNSFQSVVDLLEICLDDKFSIRNKEEDLKLIYNSVIDIALDFNNRALVKSIMEGVFVAFRELYTIQKVMPNLTVLNVLMDKIAKQDYPEKVDLNFDQILKDLGADDRGIHMKREEIIPEQDFWEEAQRLYQKHGEKCISSKNENYPSEWMKKKLTGKTSNKEFYGYKRKDKNKETPIKLKSKKIRELLGENHDRWKVKK